MARLILVKIVVTLESVCLMRTTNVQQMKNVNASMNYQAPMFYKWFSVKITFEFYFLWSDRKNTKKLFAMRLDKIELY